jgi:outer membrane protein assembly factor BamB
MRTDLGFSRALLERRGSLTPVGPILATLTACTPDPPPVAPCAEVAEIEVTAPTGRAHDRLVTLTLTEAADAALLCQADDEPDDRVLLESSSAGAHSFRLQGLRAGATYRCAAGPTCAPRAFTVEPLSARFAPEVEVTGEAPEGWLLAGVLTRGCRGPGTLALFDPAGRVRWDAPLRDARMDFEVQQIGDGVILYGGATPTTGPAAVHLWDGVLWEAQLPDDREFHHDAKQLADGRVLTLEARDNVAGGQSWRGFGVRAFDPATMAVSYEYDSQAAFDQGALPAGSGDVWHANWVDLLDHGDGPRLYVSLCYPSQVLAIDATTGQVEWVFGPGGDFALFDTAGDPLPDEQFTQCQHGLDVSADGRRLLAYDNGRERDASRVVEYALDPEAVRATLSWEWTDGWRENILGDADWLPDGDVLVTQGHPECYDGPGDRTEIVKVDPATGTERWRFAFVDPWMAVYRSELLDGCALLANVGQCRDLEPRWAELAPRFYGEDPAPGAGE